MSHQRPGDTIPLQQETEAVIDRRLGIALPTFTPKSEGGDLWVAGVDFDMGPNFTSDGSHPVCAYVANGRVYWQGLAVRDIGTEVVITDTLPDELQQGGDFGTSPSAVAAEFGPDYADVLIIAFFSGAGLSFYLPVGMDQDALIWLNGLSYPAPSATP